jgi:hypothetical protein
MWMQHTMMLDLTAAVFLHAFVAMLGMLESWLVAPSFTYKPE